MFNINDNPCPFDKFPVFGSGNRSERTRILREQEFRHEFKQFTGWMSSVVEGLGFAPGTRTWCYLFEQAQLIQKGQFRSAVNWLSKHRKHNIDANPYGLFVPRHLICDDATRGMEGGDWINTDASGRDYVMAQVKFMFDSLSNYTPNGFWDYQSYAPILVCEKRDIMMLCRQSLPRAIRSYATKGYGDINSRYALIDQIMEYEDMGVTPIVFLLYDHDPAGFHITDIFRKGLREAGGAIGWDNSHSLRIERIGLSTRQVLDYGFTQIPGLETSSGKDLTDPDHEHAHKEYVKSYREEIGDWKCESNALITSPEACDKIMKDTVLRYISAAGVDQWRADNREANEEVTLYKDQLKALMHFATESELVLSKSLLLQQQAATRLNLLKGS